MYISLEDEYVIRVPPELLNDDYSVAVAEASKSMLEGKLVDIQEDQKSLGKSYIVSVNSIEIKGEGTIVHGDGGVYQSIKYSALAYFPRMQEVVDGIVTSVQKFGAFIKFGPFEGLLHISQIMDDSLNIDMENQRIVGKDTKMELKVGDKIRVRIVALNLSSSSLSDSKIGFTAKQPGLGKQEWIKKENISS
jgi:DNA-directed RNA polymerase subunit E'